MYKKLNLQYLFSYLGLIPYFIILIDKYFFTQIKEQITIDFIIYYTVIIFVFIGSTNWNFKNKPSNLEIIYGFLPSSIGTIIIILNLYLYNNLIIEGLVIAFIILQLILDYIFLYSKNSNKRPFYFLRLPLTLIITIIIGMIIF